MSRLLAPLSLAAAVVTLPMATLPAAAQTSPAQGWPQNKPPAQAAPPQAQPAPKPPASAQPTTPPAQGAAAPVPLPIWFHEIDTAKKGEVTRADFLKYRMKTFEQLDTNKDGKVSLEEFLKVAEAPFTTDGPGLPPLAERQARARQEFLNLDTNRDGFIDLYPGKF